MKHPALILAVAFFVMTSVLSFADEPGVIYDAGFPFTVTLDGDFGDWPLVPWHEVTHDMGWG
jgi:hypothetical protein